MKNTKISLALLSSLFWLGSCQSSFLDVKPYDSLPVNSALTNENDMGSAVNGMYSGLRSSFLYGRTVPFVGDLLADNVYISSSNSGRYITQNTYQVNAQNADLLNTWTQAYAVILRANNIINATLTGKATINQFKGEALTVRALMNWEMVRMFAKPYAVDQNGPGVPLVMTYDVNLRPARNTVKEVYAQIQKDLTDAMPLLTISKNSSLVTKYVARALQAKVYLYQQDYANALTAAQDVITNGGYTLATAANLNAYWNNPTPVTTKLETIFEISADGVNNAGFDALANMYNQSGYGDGLATNDLYNLYTDTDARKALIVKGKRAGVDALIVNKYQNVQNTSEKDDIKILRYADVILIAAEASARTGKATDALTLLNQVAQRRDPSFKGYSSTGDGLISDIITERRKELAFEGDRFNDLNRLGLDLKRNDQYPSAARSIPATDSRRVAPIPQSELDANQSIKQNSGY
ncbi:RagB/SusD family nutrient uptake outer membrane protein [Spirosoma sp. BT702]|uniref:RagB/SusD family nutrient uptake outer membrane protein n=1 Tax=Spirosoma profusum TaxID=2771354 RepID=A0A927AN23_9BACT|nr:RagB/SusD family nutrient uptake outer membrane protein [Spirosoma profusum]MBD2700964.1 RagB/SusD family nutrient uptake outer membrane protein [Spirosoma profusum]